LEKAIDKIIKIEYGGIMEIELRLEDEKDYSFVEELTRDAFWNVHFPGCGEHLLIHNLRNAKEFVKELDFVANYNKYFLNDNFPSASYALYQY
jgi:hypothetical protein